MLEWYYSPVRFVPQWWSQENLRRRLVTLLSFFFRRRSSLSVRFLVAGVLHFCVVPTHLCMCVFLYFPSVSVVRCFQCPHSISVCFWAPGLSSSSLLFAALSHCILFSEWLKKWQVQWRTIGLQSLLAIRLFEMRMLKNGCVFPQKGNLVMIKFLTISESAPSLSANTAVSKCQSRPFEQRDRGFFLQQCICVVGRRDNSTNLSARVTLGLYSLSHFKHQPAQASNHPACHDASCTTTPRYPTWSWHKRWTCNDSWTALASQDVPSPTPWQGAKNLDNLHVHDP